LGMTLEDLDRKRHTITVRLKDARMSIACP
jgi:hypothetical protein